MNWIPFFVILLSLVITGIVYILSLIIGSRIEGVSLDVDFGLDYWFSTLTVFAMIQAITLIFILACTLVGVL
jgi:hypothetical protein